MQRTYRYLTYSDRVRIEELHNTGARAKAIAAKIGASLSTLYHELKRGNTGEINASYRPIYSAELAQRRTMEAIARRGRKRAGTDRKF